MSSPASSLGSPPATASTPPAKKSMVAWMSNGGRLKCSSHLVARSVSLRASSSARTWAEVSTAPSSARNWSQNPGMSKTSRATSHASVRCGTEAPVSSFSRNANVMPDLSTISLITAVLMISLCRRCDGIRLVNRSRSGIGKYLFSARLRYGSSGTSEASTSWPSAILVCASSTENSGSVRPEPVDRRSAMSLSAGRTSSRRLIRPSRSSFLMYLAWTCSICADCALAAARALFWW